VVREAAKAAGVRLEISYSYRTYEKQVEKYEIYKNGGNRAADPGTSNHGWGTALDLGIPTYPEANTDPQFRWLKTNALRFGFHNNDSPSEPWHWDYEGGHPIEEDRMTPEEKAEFDARRRRSRTTRSSSRRCERVWARRRTPRHSCGQASVWRVRFGRRKGEEEGQDERASKPHVSSPSSVAALLA
jgi:hypothetical protein